MAKVKQAHSLERGQLVDVEILSIAGGGAGVAKIDGVPVFIERAVVGDQLKVMLFDVRKDFARGRIEQVLKPGAGRTKPECKHFERCGGCQWQQMTYAEQLRSKERLVKETLVHLGGGAIFSEERLQSIMQPIIGCHSPFNYRNKAQFPFQFQNGKTLAGYFEHGSHNLVNIDTCSIQPAVMDHVLHVCRDLVRGHRLSIYDERKHRGLLRHLNVRMSFAEEKLLVTFVINHEPVKYRDFAQDEYLQVFTRIAQDLMAEVDSVASVALNFNPEKGNRIMGDATLNVLGRGYIEEVLKSGRHDLPKSMQQGLRFRLSSESFFQVNSEQSVKLLELVHDYAAEALGAASGSEAVIVDAYAGVGTIALWLAHQGSEIFAIEENEEAVKDGKTNAELNGISNLTFLAARVEDALDELLQDREQIDLLVLDPPRKGVDGAVLRSIKERGPRHIIYVSCNPATLARDLKILESQDTDGEESAACGYKTIRIRPVDLFPQTYHVETVVLLTRN